MFLNRWCPRWERQTKRPARGRNPSSTNRCRLELKRLEDRLTPSPVAFTGVGADAATALNSYQAAIGGVNNGVQIPQIGGFRKITWDGVGLGATDGAFTNTVITPNHTVGIPLNRFQRNGVFFEEVYAVSDTGFTTENPGLQPPVQFPAFSPTKTFAMFNDNSIDFRFVVPSAPGTAPVQAASRGFGAIFLDVEKAGTTSIEYFHGTSSLGKFFVPPGASTQAEFLGVLFDDPVVTSVSITVGEGVLFSLNGTTVTSGPADLSVSGTVDQVATDDFVYPEPVVVPATIVTAAGPGGAPEVRTFNATNGAPELDILAYGASFRGGVHVAMGDVNGDGVPDIITGAGAGGGPHVKVFNGRTGALLTSFFALEQGFRGGVMVAAGDVNGDGKADIIVGAGPGGGPRVVVYNGADLAFLHSFFAYDESFKGGVTVAAGDVNGDGKADIITGAGLGGAPHVEAFRGTDLKLLQSFFAFDKSLTGGVLVSAGDVNGDGKDDILTGAGGRGSSQVKVFNAADLSVLLDVFPYSKAFLGGATVAAVDLNGDGKAEVICGTGPGARPQLVVYDGAAAPVVTLLEAYFAFDPRFLGGIFVGAGG
jgi:FG-GAP-like repeat